LEEDHQCPGREKEFKAMGSSVFPAGSRVPVVSYGPFRGLRGTIRTVDIIADDSEEPYCFYHIALDGSQIKQAIWFEYDEVELVAAPSLASQETGQLPVVEKRRLLVST
jgi:hypothetical protein